MIKIDKFHIFIEHTSLLTHTVMRHNETIDASQNAELFQKHMCNKQLCYIPISLQTQVLI